jgi:hypothetical protein
MSEKPISYALTTKGRVKDRLGLDKGNFDTLLDRIIAGVTDLIEGECGGRRFLRTTYTNELITIFNSNQKILPVKNIPLVSISSLQYRTGLKSNPNYTDFNDDDWEILDDGASGLIRVWGLSQDINMVRLTYIGGYLIDFDNAGTATHTLPFDLSDLAERLTIKLFKRREHEGKASESFEGGNISWKELFDDVDKAVIARYKRLPVFI